MNVQEEREILAALIKEIETAAEEEIKKILLEAEEERKRIIQEAEKRAIEEKKRRENELRRKVKMEVLRELSIKRINARKEYLISKYKIILNLIKEIRENVDEISKRRDERYLDGLKYLVKEAVQNIKNNDIRIICNKHDFETIKDIIAKYRENTDNDFIKSKNIEIDPILPLDEYGIIAVSKDKKEYFVNTISSRTDFFINEYLPKLLK